MSSEELIRVAEKERDSGVATLDDLTNLESVIELTESVSDGTNYTLATSGGGLASYDENVTYVCKFETQNDTTSINVRIDGLGYISMYSASGGNPVAGSIKGASGLYDYTTVEFRYDAVRDDFRLSQGSAGFTETTDYAPADVEILLWQGV